jgi:hypothetical protein
MNSSQKCWTPAVIILGFALALLRPTLSSGATGGVLTNVVDIITLSEDRAKSQIPILVTGTVTFVEPTLGGSFFVQDATGGVFVYNPHGLRPATGDIVRVSGTTTEGAYAPSIMGSNYVKLGAGPLPPARVISIDRLMSGEEDCQRVEVSGIVRAAQMSETESNLDLTIASAGYRFDAFPNLPPGTDLQHLAGARVRLKGTAGAFFNLIQRRLTAVKLFMPLPGDFVVESTESVDPFTEPLLALNNIAQYRNDQQPDQRVHVKGRVTYQRPGDEVFLQDDTGALCVKTRQSDIFAVGDMVEA